VAQFVNVVAFMGVTYFDQVILVWYALLALTSRLASFAKATASAQDACLLGSHSPLSDLPGLRPEFGPPPHRLQKALR
jgi:hypothetical protein